MRRCVGAFGAWFPRWSSCSGSPGRPGGGGAVAALSDSPHLAGSALLGSAAGVAMGLPLALGFRVVTTRRGLAIGVEQAVQQRVLESEARRREFETRLGRALEMTDDELRCYEVVERALRQVVPGGPAELLLADNSHAHFERVVATAPDGRDAPGCLVDSPDRCVAARRAQTQIFLHSEDLDACPLLREPGDGPCSAVCVPVSIMGTTVGVTHITGSPGEPPDPGTVEVVQALANLAGNRLGMLRMMADTQLQAATDGLTGLVNRRSLEQRARQLRAQGTDYALAIADLDNFKTLNDRHGHETGDRALRVFAQTLREPLRSEDIACRYGGEEFVVLLPNADAHEAIDAMGRVRELLAHLTGRGDVPSFTASYGIAYSSEADDFVDLVNRADQALLVAKNSGRNRICLDGHDIAVAPTLTTVEAIQC